MSTLAQAASRNPVDPWAWRTARAAPTAAPEQGSGRAKRGLAKYRLAAALALAVAAGAYGAHAQSARLSPWIEPFLHGLGKAWRAPALRVEKVSSRLIADGHGPILMVEGALINAGRQDIETPRLRLAVRSADGAEMFVWTAHAAKSRLGAGEQSRFSSRLEAPPSAGFDVAVSIENGAE